MSKYFMRKFLLTIVATTIVCSVWAQPAYRDMRKNRQCAAGNYMAYPEQKKYHYTAPPKGTHPFYISHYGRQGSRYHSKIRNYDYPWTVMHKADSLGKLTPLGREIFSQIGQMRQEAANRWGEMSPLGVWQQRQIARRMMEHHPEVFQGEVHIDAKSTIISRCILSMETEVLQLLSMNPGLTVSHDASFCYMDYLNHGNNKRPGKKMPEAAQQALNEYLAQHPIDDAYLTRLFNDPEYVGQAIKKDEFSDLLFKLACSQQNTLLRDSMPLLRIYSQKELYNYWQRDNAWWYLSHGGSPLNQGAPPYIQHVLLRTMIAEADSCIALEKPGVQLRFGHDHVMMELLSLLGANGYGLYTDDLSTLEQRGWISYKAIPMAANVQLIFYRHDRHDSDVYVKLLLNEQEATLPLPAKKAPYYRWSDFRQYYLEKIETYLKRQK